MSLHTLLMPTGDYIWSLERQWLKWALVGFEGRAAIGYDYGYDAEVFYLRVALAPKYVEGIVEGCLERIGEDAQEGEDLLRGEWEEGIRRWCSRS